VKPFLLSLLIFSSFFAVAQKEEKKNDTYDRKEEILHKSNRYRLHNNYLTVGGGFLSSSIRNVSQKQVGADFHFHIRREHFQLGLMMSGLEFLSNNHVQGHFGYGKRWEDNQYNFAVFGGVTYSDGVKTITDTLGRIYPELYNAWGGYVCIQGVMKFAYDIGIGAELFYELNQVQSLGGFRIILFFSGSYRGPKQRVNPHVRSENPK
jgi:hypothetical protein